MGQAGPGPTQWGKPALCPSPTSPGKIQPVLSLSLAHYQPRRRQSRRKHGCRELKTARQRRAHTWGGLVGGNSQLETDIWEPRSVLLRGSSPHPAPGRDPPQNRPQGPLKSFNVYWKRLWASFGPCPQGTHSPGERTHNQHDALCKCRRRRADPGPDRQSLLNLLGRPGVEQPRRLAAQCTRGLRTRTGTAVRRWHKPGSVLGTMQGRRGQDGERTCVVHTGLRREKPWRSLRRASSGM